MFRTKLLLILPLLVAVTVGQSNSKNSYYGTSNVLNQRPQPIYGQKRFNLPRRPMPVTGPVTTAPEAPITPAPIRDRPSDPAAPPAPTQPSTVAFEPFLQHESVTAPTNCIFCINVSQSPTPMTLPLLLLKPQPVREPAPVSPMTTTDTTVTYPTQTSSHSYPPTLPQTVATQAPPVEVTTQQHQAVTQAPGQIKLDFQCKEGNGYYFVEHECDAYIECKQNRAMKYTCPDSLLFNPAAKHNEDPCAYPSEVKCTAQAQASREEAKRSKKPDLPNALCKQRNAYYKVDASCDSYVECTDFVANEMSCPEGLHYNPEAKWPNYPCGYPMDVPCAERGPAQPAQPTADCPHQYGYFASPAATPDNCSSYRVCVAGKAIDVVCPLGLAFNLDTSSCDWPDQVASCNANQFLGFSCPADANGTPLDMITNYKYQDNCHYFFSCEKGRARLLSCDKGLAFDPASGRCVHEDYVNCDVTEPQ